jgi:glycosyltransferase involved in cell wall biosynthesis
MPRILRLTNRFNLGGPTYNVALLTKYLAPEFETLLVGARHEPGEESSEFILRDLGVEYMILPSMGRDIHPLKDFKTLLEVISLIRRFRPHIVHTHASKAGAVGRVAAWLCRVPVVVHTFHGHVFHSYFSPSKTAFYKNLERFLASLSDAIVAISPRQREELAFEHKICRPEKIHVIPLGFQLERFLKLGENDKIGARHRYQIPEGTFVLGAVGRLAPIKNHALLIEAFAAFSARVHPKPRLVIVGDGPLREELQAKAHSLGLKTGYRQGEAEADVLFTGWIKYVEEILPAFDVMVLSSLNEGTPVSLIEAQAAGLPVISTHVGGVEDVVFPGKTSLLVPTGDAVALAQAMEDMYRRKDEIQTVIREARRFVSNTFSAEALAKNMRNLYFQLLSKSQAFN